MFIALVMGRKHNITLGDVANLTLMFCQCDPLEAAIVGVGVVIVCAAGSNIRCCGGFNSSGFGSCGLSSGGFGSSGFSSGFNSGFSSRTRSRFCGA